MAEKIKPEKKEEIINDIEASGVNEKIAKAEEKLDEKATIETEKKEEIKIKEKPKKDTALINAKNIPMSTKEAMSICRFIKNKKIGDAIRDLQEVIKLKKAVPMKGETPHRRGKIGGGRYPVRAAGNFIVLLKGLAGNSSEMDEPIIYEGMANIASRPYGRFGRTRKKRTNIVIKAIEKSKFKDKRKNKKGGVKK
jgi:hypothetical protein